MRRWRWTWRIFLVVAMAWPTSCVSDTAALPDGGREAGVDPDALVTPDAGDAAVACGCTPGPHGNLIYVLSDDSEIYSYDPVTNEFAFLSVLTCAGHLPYSMAVDQRGIAWVLYGDDHDIYSIDLHAPSQCGDPGYTPGVPGFDLFGMAFTATGDGACPRLFAHSYSGSGPFSEGVDLGQLGYVEPTGGPIHVLGAIDYNGGELAGTGDGRLFAFAGLGPAKLVEYDRDTGAAVETIPLDGFNKTTASAFAFFAGDFYFFTEAPPTGCDDCLTLYCPADLTACEGDPTCADHLACAIAQGYINDECGGLLPAAMQTCLQDTCGVECLPPLSIRVSQVTHFDYDDSDGQGRVLTVVYSKAPIRVVGAGTSPCVPFIPL